MKKKLTAMVTAVAMMATLVPSAVFATEAAPTSAPAVVDNGAPAARDISVSLFGFNNNPNHANIFVQVSGSDAVKGSRIACYLDGVAEPVLSDILDTTGTNEFAIPKSKIPNINDPYASNKLTVTIYNQYGSAVLFTKVFTQSYAASTAEKVVFGVEDGNGTTNRQFTAKFDSKYYPGANDYIKIEGLDSAGNTVGNAINIPLSAAYLSSDVDADNMRTYNSTLLKRSLNDKAVSARLSFYSDGAKVDAFTNTVSLASRYGELKELKLVFDNSEIHRGDTVTGHLYYINKAGNRYDITADATYTYQDGGRVCTNKKTNQPQFTVKADAAYGSNVVVSADYGSFKTVYAHLTVAEKIAVNAATTDRSSIKADNKATRLTMTFAKKLDFTPSKISNVRWVDANDTTASVEITPLMVTQSNVALGVKSDKPCTGKIEVTVEDAQGHKYRALSNTVTFTDPNAKDKHTVTLTIGSKTMDVNGVSKESHVAPLIYQNRTYVPLRSVGEALGADFEWDAKTSTITIKQNNTTVIMKPGHKTYTVNGVQKSMEVAPYIVAGANRTMIPLRFVGEALDYNFEVKYRPDGTTEKVIIRNYK